jgi:hypothetical protein
MTFPSSWEIKPRLQAFFSSRFVIVEAGQSSGASLGAAGETSDATLFVASAVALATTLLEATPTVAAEPFFFTILGCV